MLDSYPACFIKEETGYSVIFPDLNGLATCGQTLDEAFTMAMDCLAGYLCTLREDGDPIPPPSLLEAVDPAVVLRDLELPDSETLVQMVTVDVEEYAAAHFKKEESLPDFLKNGFREQGRGQKASEQSASQLQKLLEQYRAARADSDAVVYAKTYAQKKFRKKKRPGASHYLSKKAE